MNLYLLIGKPNTRKTSIARSLTGALNRSLRDIRSNNGQDLDVYIRVSSLQESNTSPQEFYDEMLKAKQCNILFCLWPVARRNSKVNPNNSIKYPDANTYIDFFQNKECTVKKIAALNSAVHLPCVKNQSLIKEIKNTVHEPINVSSAQVRRHFEWK